MFCLEESDLPAHDVDSLSPYARSWIRDALLSEKDQSEEHPTYHYLPLPWEWCEHLGPAPTTHYCIDLYIDSLYDVFRLRPDATPVSLPVLIEMRRLQRHLKVWTVDRREDIELTAEERERALEAARAEKKERVLRGVKRGREESEDEGEEPEIERVEP